MKTAMFDLVAPSLGKGEVRGSIPRGSTTKPNVSQRFRANAPPCPPAIGRERALNIPHSMGEIWGTRFAPCSRPVVWWRPCDDCPCFEPQDGQEQREACCELDDMLSVAVEPGR